MLANIGSQNSKLPSSSTKEAATSTFASPRNSTPSSNPMKKAKSAKAAAYAAKPSTKKTGTYSPKTQAIKRLMKIDKMK
jgi:hypothetical protein